MKEFNNKVAVITGGANGIGKCLADRLVQAGAKVLIADIDAKRLDDAAAEIRAKHGGHIVGQVVDVTKLESVKAMADRAYAEYGAVHLLFNNAGIGLGEASRKLWDLPENDWHWGIDVNLMGVVHGINVFVPRMLAAGEEGVIINTSSGNGGLRSLPNTPIYAATKAAMTSLSEVLHQQLLREGGKLRTAILFPGPYTVNTAIMASKRNRPDDYGGADAKGVAYEKMEDLVKTTGLKLALTEPDDVAEFALQGIQKGNFWLIPESPDADMHVRKRTDCILERGTPASAW